MLTSRSLLQGVGMLRRRDPDLDRIAASYGPPPLWARPPGFATLVRIMLEQQVSLASGRAAYRRLQGAAGRVTPRRIAAMRQTQLRRAGLTRQKAAYCHELATTIAGGGLRLAELARLDDEAARANLIALRGIGPWTADIYLLMALRRPDVWPDGDLALARSAQRVKRLAGRPDDDALRRMARRWRPWRAVAARLLWHAYLCERARGAGATT